MNGITPAPTQQMIDQGKLIVEATDAGQPYTAGIGELMNCWAEALNEAGVEPELAARLAEFDPKGTC